MDDSIFSKIVNNKIPSYKVYEDKNFLAFLDAYPLALGHVLVIPKKQDDYLFDLDEIEYLGLWRFSKKVAKAMDKVLTCERIGVSVIGFEVPHAHIHLVPINDIADLDFSNRKEFTKGEMIDVASRISYAI